jgi:SAM-dependent methyltransferase
MASELDPYVQDHEENDRRLDRRSGPRQEDQAVSVNRNSPAAKGLLQSALALGPVRRTVRRAADWVDLQYSFILEQIAKAAPRAQGRLLDVGCGDKPYEPTFRPYVTEYIGIEHEGVFAQTNASTSERRPDLYYDGNRLPFGDASFDTVLSIQVLEHTPRPVPLLREMARVLRPGGLLILSAPFSGRLHEEPFDFFRYTPHGLRAICAEAGLEVTEVWDQGNIWSVIGHKLNSFLAFRVAGIQGLAMQIGKHEQETSQGPKSKSRPWTLPVVAPAMFAIASGARVLDRVAPDVTESLSYMIFARHRAG